MIVEIIVRPDTGYWGGESTGTCATCRRQWISYSMFVFWDAQLKEDGPTCTYCGAADWRIPPPVFEVRFGNDR